MAENKMTSLVKGSAPEQNERPSFEAKELLRKRVLSLQPDLSVFEPASEKDKAQQEVMRPASTFLKDGIKNFKKNKLAMSMFFILLALIILIFLTPYINPYGYDEVIRINGRRDKSLANLGPLQWSKMEQKEIDQGVKLYPHLFGTDSVGRDYYVRCMVGTKISLGVGFFASLIVLVIGLIYGSVAGYLGGKVDLIMMRIVDIIYALPDTLIIILLSVVLREVLKDKIQGTIFATVGTNMLSLFIVFGLLYWVGMARLVRGQILTLREMDFVMAAESIGANKRRIIRRHVLPNCISVIIISTALQIPSAIFTESFLSFLGLGVAVPTPSLGSLANDARESIQSYPHKLVFPSILICLLVLSLNIIGDGLRDAFDPKLRK